jgi:hypothetical protein
MLAFTDAVSSPSPLARQFSPLLGSIDGKAGEIEQNFDRILGLTRQTFELTSAGTQPLLNPEA